MDKVVFDSVISRENGNPV
ncbi:hypothetical protein J001_02189 [Cryptococcus neoformans]|nr:hypothetical protein J004_02248 [Cryptococcus neoformans var. grubii]OXH72502.1 hypothetical protein J001_02189 [Cryptococcus neoformans var. grubii]